MRIKVARSDDVLIDGFLKFYHVHKFEEFIISLDNSRIFTKELISKNVYVMQIIYLCLMYSNSLTSGFFRKCNLWLGGGKNYD